MLADIEKLFGLKAQGEEGDKLVLTAYEMEQLRAAYEKSINGTASSQYDQAEYVLYGTYEPLSVTITHIINNKSGISFTSYSHTGLPVAVLAEGAGSEMFNGYYDNTDIYNKLADLLNYRLSWSSHPSSAPSGPASGIFAGGGPPLCSGMRHFPVPRNHAKRSFHPCSTASDPILFPTKPLCWYACWPSCSFWSCPPALRAP